MNFPIATYRIQFHKEFGFEKGAALASYLKSLGISHLYASPCLKAVSGSPHGYDGVDFTRVNPELGGTKGHERLCRALKKAGLKQILDIVPNHMAAHSRQNPMWRDVLAAGPLSPFAEFFDIHWHTRDVKTRKKVLLPILGDHYDACLARKQLQFKRRGSEIVLTYFEHDLPLSTDGIDALREAGATRFPLPEQRKATPEIKLHGERIDRLLSDINDDPDRIHELLELQHYRLAHWRTGASDINFRRFFDVNDLVGLRMEREAVFKKSHRLILKWIGSGLIDGLRIDHPDGLGDPEEYLTRLAECAPHVRVVVEKILETSERLPESWPVSGTTGYDFLNRVNGLFVDPDGEVPLTRLYEDLTGQLWDYPETIRQKKHLILQKSFSGEIDFLTRLLLEIRFRHRRYRDLIQSDLRGALKEVIACFPVYRTYIRPCLSEISSQDGQWIKSALSRARARSARVDELAWELLENLLLLKVRGEGESDFVIRFQQLTGPAMAKGVEDTAFYCFNRLISLNEVGGNPGIFGSTVECFHEYCRFIQAHYPGTLSATATHDAKRGEDIRLRINLLSEIPGKWSYTVRRWFKIAAKYQDSGLPDANTQYFLYQTLVGAWPIDVDRLTGYMQKAVREAKVYTSWTDPDAFYESALSHFIEKLLLDEAFISDLEKFLKELLWPARCSSLSQTLIKCMAPGIPDFYQGTELWDLNLVDPDNRRPVDFDHRRRLLSQIKTGFDPENLPGVDIGLPKLFVIQKALSVRRTLSAEFGEKGRYRPMQVRGSKAKHVAAFARGERIIALAPRLIAGFDGHWEEAVVDLPYGAWRNVFTEETLTGGEKRMQDLLARFPVALLVRDQSRA